MEFAPDAKIQQIAEAYALDAIDLAKKNFGVTLDGTDESIAQVESVFVTLHQAMAQKPPAEVIWTFAKTFGSYTGEVFRKHHGGEWGRLSQEGSIVATMRWNGTLFWPFARAHKRIVDGPENNIWHYYQTLRM